MPPPPQKRSVKQAQPPSPPPSLVSKLIPAVCALVLAVIIASTQPSLLSSFSSLFSPSPPSSPVRPTPRGSLPSPPHWGTFRPNVYAGVRGTWGSSPVFGWMWSCANVDENGRAFNHKGKQPQKNLNPNHNPACTALQQLEQLRHDAEERDGISKYGWLKHNGNDFGIQGIVDRKMGINLTTTFIQPRNASGSMKDRWVMRIEGQAVATDASRPKQAVKEQTISLFFYTGLGDEQQRLELLNRNDIGKDRGEVVQRLWAGAEGGELHVRSALSSGSPKQPHARTYYYGERIDLSPGPPSASLQRARAANQAPPQRFTWSAKENVRNILAEKVRPPLLKWQQAQQQAYRAHQARRDRDRRPFQPEPQPEFLATLPNTFERGSNFFVVQHVLTTPFSMDFVVAPRDEDERMQLQQSQPQVADEGGATGVRAEVGRVDRWFASSQSTPAQHQPQSLSHAIQQRSEEFDARFQQLFPSDPSLLEASASNNKKNQRSMAMVSTQQQKEFRQAILSNLVGGIGFFHGKQLIEVEAEKKDYYGNVIPARVVESEESSLLTCVPSRSFFPRGFMWDEGFHQLLVSRWDLDLSLHVLDSWFAQIRSDSIPVGGWLPREQILGEEARQRVPDQFRVQKPRVANPPTLILALQHILQRMLEQKTTASTYSQHDLTRFTRFLQKWLPTLHLHVQWFLKTQASTTNPISKIGVIDSTTGHMPVTSHGQSTLPQSFRWDERTIDHNLPSGLDDYPRARRLPNLQKDKTGVPTPPAQSKRDKDRGLDESTVTSIGAEGHVDLHAWMVVLAKTMAGLTQYVHEHQEQYEATNSATSTANATNGNGRNTTGPKIDYAKVSSSYSSYASLLSKRLIQLHWNPSRSSFADYIYHNGSRHFVHHFGYVSLLPVFLGAVDPNSPELLKVLEKLDSDEWGVWSEYGIRSLSRHDKLYGSGEDYWRGAIWINMQYLAVSSLQFYATHPDSPPQVKTRALELGNELRRRVANNVMQEYARTGFVWEQYSSTDGKGRRSHPFTGWTALTLLITTNNTT